MPSFFFNTAATKLGQRSIRRLEFIGPALLVALVIGMQSLGVWDSHPYITTFIFALLTSLGSYLIYQSQVRGQQLVAKLSDALNFNQKVIGSSAVGILAFHEDGHCILANPAIATIVGGSQEQLLQQNFREIQSWKNCGAIEFAEQALATEMTYQLQVDVTTSFGKNLWLQWIFTSFSIHGEKHILVMLRDITDIQSARAALEKSNRELMSVLAFNEAILMNSPLPMTVFTANGQCVEANDAFAQFTGQTRETLLSMHFHKSDAWKRTGVLDSCLIALETASPQRLEIQYAPRSGKEIFAECRILPIHLNGEDHLLMQFTDLTERKRLEEELRSFAFHDALTRIPNRRLLLDRLQQALRGSVRNHSHVAVLFIDLNKFKQLNDAHGHDVGDQLLIEVANRLKKLVRATDTVARLGGDEFVVLLENLGANHAIAAEYVRVVAQKLHQTLSEEYVLGEILHRGSASIGIKLFLGDDADPDELLKEADAAMYEMKKGRT